MPAHNIVYKQWRESAINETNMNKTNGSAKMKVSAKKPPLLIHETVVCKAKPAHNQAHLVFAFPKRSHCKKNQKSLILCRHIYVVTKEK